MEPCEEPPSNCAEDLHGAGPHVSIARPPNSSREFAGQAATFHVRSATQKRNQRK
jgi:hypothetical protein